MKISAPLLAACMVLAAASAPGLPIPFPAWLLGSATALGLSLVLHSRFHRFLHPTALLAACMALAAWRSLPPGSDLTRVIPPRAHALDVRLEIAGDPVPQEDGFRVPVWIREIRYTPEWEPVTARAQLRATGAPPDALVPGSRWLARGRVEPGQAAFTGLRGASWIYRVDSEHLTPLDGTPSPRHLFFRARDVISTRLSAATTRDPEAADVLQALLLARRGDVDDEWTRRFARTGTIHIFAVSGLHLGILAGFLLFVSRHIGVSHRWRGLVILPVLFAFTACTGFRASALRALIMATCLLLAPMVYRRPHPASAFSLAAFFILGWAPEQLRDIGFQYSFLLVGGLLVFAHAFDKRLAAWMRGDPWSPADVQWPWWKRRLAGPALSLFFVNALSFLLSAPLTARTFNLFSPVALLGNLFAIPLVFLLLATGFPALLLLVFPAHIASLFFLPALKAARLLLDWVRWSESLPGGVWWVPSPPAWQLAFFYGLPLAWAFIPKQRKRLAATALLFAGFALTQHVLDATRAEAVVLGVDRGQASWVRNGPRGALLVDTGSNWSGRAVRDALRKRGVNRVPALFITHPQRDHAGGVHHLLETHPPERIFVAGPDLGHPAYEGLDPIPLHAGDVLQIAGWQVDVLWPPKGHRARSMGERSLVLRFSDRFASYLVMGGANERVEARLVEKGIARPARLLHAGNSPRVPGCSPAFLETVRPEAVVFSGSGFQGITEARELSESRTSLMGLPVWRVPGDGWLRFDLRAGTQVE